MTLITPSKIVATLETITRDQMARCLRITKNGEVFYNVRSESTPNTYYEVHYSPDFSFTCTCPSGQHAFGNVKHPSGVCKHVRWSLATSMEYKRLSKVDASTIEVAEYRPGVHTDDFQCSDGYMATYYPHSLRRYTCLCPVDHQCGAEERPICVHIQAAKVYREMLHQELADYEREINR